MAWIKTWIELIDAVDMLLFPMLLKKQLAGNAIRRAHERNRPSLEMLQHQGATSA